MDALEPSPMGGGCRRDLYICLFPLQLFCKGEQSQAGGSRLASSTGRNGASNSQPQFTSSRMATTYSVAGNPLAGNAGKYSIPYYHAGRRFELSSGADVQCD